jgi:prefoldin subunit 5
MANDGNEGENFSKDDCTEESIESLRKEVERLKTRLEEERKKLNDISCKPELIANNNSLFSK